MITVRQILKNISKGESTSGFRGLLLKSYEDYRKSTIIKLITASYNLPYKNNYTDPYFAIHYKILSEKIKNIFYDVIIQFITDDKIVADTQVRLFCNSPQFTFTYAYCYGKEGDLIFNHLYPKEVLNEYPKMKNPLCLKGLDKHVYACLKHTVANKINYSSISKFGKNQWVDIMDINSFNVKVNSIIRSMKNK